MDPYMEGSYAANHREGFHPFRSDNPFRYSRAYLANKFPLTISIKERLIDLSYESDLVIKKMHRE